jgi:hypothetical protein
MLVYRDTTLPIETRIDAAKAAIGYESPRLAAIEARVDQRTAIEVLSAEEQALRVAELRERARRLIRDSFREFTIEHEPVPAVPTENN